MNAFTWGLTIRKRIIKAVEDATFSIGYYQTERQKALESKDMVMVETIDHLISEKKEVVTVLKRLL